MSTSHRTVALVGLAVVLATAAVAVFWYLPPASRTSGGPLTGREVRALVAGNTIKGPKFSEYYDPDGSIRGREIEDTDEEYLGSWHVDGDQLCVAFPSHNYTSCVAITPEEGGAYDFADEGRHSKRTIAAGNPGKL